MNKKEWIINLSQEALNRINREDCSVVIVCGSVTALVEGDGLRKIPNWTIRATDKNNHSALINDFETLPEESDDQIKEKLVKYFLQADWK